MVLRTDLTYLNLSMSLFTQPVRRILAEKRTWLALAIIVPLVLLVTCVHGTLFSSRSVVARVYLQARYIDTRTAHFSEAVHKAQVISSDRIVVAAGLG